MTRRWFGFKRHNERFSNDTGCLLLPAQKRCPLVIHAEGGNENIDYRDDKYDKHYNIT